MLRNYFAVFYRCCVLSRRPLPLLLLLPADLTTVPSSEDRSVFWTLVYSVIYICVCWPSKRHFQHHIISSLLHRSIVLFLFGSPLPSVPYLDSPRKAQPLPRCQDITIYHNTAGRAGYTIIYIVPGNRYVLVCQVYSPAVSGIYPTAAVSGIYPQAAVSDIYPLAVSTPDVVFLVFFRKNNSSKHCCCVMYCRNANQYTRYPNPNSNEG